jgi:hypothetical protein
MADIKRLVSSLLLLIGVVLVFAGMSAALGFTAGGTIASLAAIVTLLYAGAVWFGRSTPPPVQPWPADAVVVFDRALRVVGGPERGAPLVAQFSPAVRADVETHCPRTFAGQGARFTCDYDGSRVEFDAVPVRAADGSIIFGMLVSGAFVRQADTAPGQAEAVTGPAALDEARAREAGRNSEGVREDVRVRI